MDEIIYDCK